MGQVADLQRFINRRNVLLTRFDELREQIDSWVKAKADEPTIGDLALLQGLLLERSAVLTQLMSNDQHVLEELLAQNFGHDIEVQ